MVAQIIDGVKVAHKIQASLSSQVNDSLKHNGIRPGLAVVQVGNDPASKIYVSKKAQACDRVGFYSEIHQLPSDASQEQLFDRITQLNNACHINGILVQLPLPQHIDSQAILEHIDTHKDVDGFHPYNLGRLAQKNPALRPCTPYGIMLLLEHYGISVKGLNATVVGASNIVGRPMALELLLAGASVSVNHRFTENIAEYVNMADLLVVAIGKPKVIQSDWIKSGAIVIDVGMNRTTEGKVIGDIDFSRALNVASWITPVPGGVGPMTVTALLKNTMSAYLEQS